MIHRPIDGGAVRATLRELRRPSGEARWLTELDPRTAAAYAELVRRHTSRIEASLDAGVIANRVGARGTMRPLSISRRSWRRRLRWAIRPGRPLAVITSDVARCYPSIAPDAVGLSLAACGADRVDELLELLARIAAAGTPGLPVGPEPSAVLANAVLAVADRSAREAGAQILRWVDDVVLTAPDRRAVVRAFDAWVRAARSVGLQPNEGKTRVWPTAEDAAAALELASPSGARPSGADGRPGSPCDDAASVRTIYRASRVHPTGHTMNGEWLLIDDRHVQRVGSGEPPVADRVVELPGATILPGFVDGHVHLTSTGLSLENEAVQSLRSAAGLLQFARERAAATSEPVVALQGFDETRWDAPALPSLAELDATVQRPLVIRRVDGHLALANSAALSAAAVFDVDGCDRDADGRPTGRVTREANTVLGRWVNEGRSEHRIEELQLSAASSGAAHGITSLHEMAMPREDGYRDVEVLLRHREKLPVDVVAIVGTTDVARAIEIGSSAVGGDLPVDGSIGARTAAVFAPYADGRGNGVTYFEDDELAEFFHGGHSAGLQVGVHALGDRAIELVLTCWERVYRSLDSRERRHFRARRHRIEHMEMASPDQIERAAVLGLAASVQPAFDATWGRNGGLYERALGPDRATAMNPFRTMIERGLVIGAGSDAPVTPLDPWLAVAAMEDHHSPAQRLSRAVALRLATVGGAELAHQEDKKGALEPGSHADFAAYDVDPFEVADVRGLRPILTVSLGREVFAA